MSSHCSKYPNCGCPPECGHCGLPEEMIKELLKDSESNFDKEGRPLTPAGTVDWEAVQIQKKQVEEHFEREAARKIREGEISPKLIKGTNRTPPKKKRKK